MNKTDPQTAEAMPRPLEGRRIGISISESNDLPALGLGNDIVNGLTVDLARRLITLGASVVLGQNWRTGGIMEAVARFALSYKSQSGPTEQPLIFNYLAFPDKPSLSDSDRKDLESILSIGTVRWTDCQNDILRALGQTSKPIDFGQYGKRLIVDLAKSQPLVPDLRRAFDLAAMRFTLTQQCDTRLVIGGRTGTYQGLAPGVIEEAWWTILLGKKLVVCGGMGGAARAVVTRDCPQAQEVMKDDSHPLAAAFLKDLHSIANSEISELCVEAILIALHG